MLPRAGKAMDVGEYKVSEWHWNISVPHQSLVCGVESRAVTGGFVMSTPAWHVAHQTEANQPCPPHCLWERQSGVPEAKEAPTKLMDREGLFILVGGAWGGLGAAWGMAGEPTGEMSWVG